jgi:hypothetical protein
LNRTGPISEQAYQLQLERIDTSFERIEKVYRGRILDVIGPDGIHMGPEDILETMLGSKPGPLGA